MAGLEWCARGTRKIRTGPASVIFTFFCRQKFIMSYAGRVTTPFYYWRYQKIKKNSKWCIRHTKFGKYLIIATQFLIFPNAQMWKQQMYSCLQHRPGTKGNFSDLWFILEGWTRQSWSCWWLSKIWASSLHKDWRKTDCWTGVVPNLLKFV